MNAALAPQEVARTGDGSALAPSPRTGSRLWSSLAGPLGGALVLVVLFILFAVAVPNGNFILPNNLIAIVQVSAPLALVAAGMTLCLVSGEVDLSVAATMGLSSVVVARGLGAGFGLLQSVGLALAVSLLVGVVNGLATARVAAYLRYFPSFLVTLASSMVVMGIAQALSPGNVSIPIIDPAFRSAFGFDNTLAGNVPLLYTVIVVGIVYLVLQRSAFGFRLFLVGANSRGARLAGVDVLRSKAMVMVLSGLLAGLAGLISAGYLSAGSFEMGNSGAELNAIAAAVLGGTALFGGRGSVLGTMVGVLVLGVLGQGVLLMQLPTQVQLIITGSVVLVAIALGEYFRRNEARPERLKRRAADPLPAADVGS